MPNGTSFYSFLFFPFPRSNISEMRKLYKDAYLKKHNVKLGFMSAFVKAAAYALVDQPAVNAGMNLTAEVWEASLCGVRLSVSLHIWYQVPGSVCEERKKVQVSVSFSAEPQNHHWLIYCPFTTLTYLERPQQTRVGLQHYVLKHVVAFVLACNRK